MTLCKTAIALLLAATTFAVQGATYTVRVSSPGIKAAPVEQPAPPTPPVAPPQLSLSLSTWDFGTVAANQSTSKTFTVSNTGTGKAALAFGALNAPFSFANGNCTAELQPQGTCNFTVTFQNYVTQTASNSALSIEQGGGVAPLSLALSGATSTGTQGVLVLDRPGISYRDGGNTVNRANGALTTDVDFYSSKVSGKWYFETQSTGYGAVTIHVPNSSVWVDLRYRNTGTTGNQISPTGSNPLAYASNSRFGWAIDVEARTVQMYNVSNCEVIRSASWTIAGAVRPRFDFRSGADSNTDMYTFVAPSGKTCIPAGYSWWNNN